MEKEIFNGKYVVYSDGKVWSNKTNKFMNYHITNRGYVRIKINKNVYALHRLVAEAFIPNPDNLPEINHINEIKTDNRVENLEWCSRRYNKNYSFKSNYPGVSWHKRSGKYQSQIYHNGKKIGLGYYNTPEKAHKVYMEYRLKHNLL